MRLGGEIVDLVGLAFLDDADEIGGIRQVAIVQDEPLVDFMRVLVNVLYSTGIEGRRPALDPVDDIALTAEVRINRPRPDRLRRL